MVSLAERDGREALRERVWGSPLLRSRVRAAARAGSIGGTAGLFDACSCDGADLVDGHALLVAVVLFIGVFILWFIIRWIVDAIRAWRRRPRPRGARLTRSQPATGYTGTIVASGPLLASPLDDCECIAFGIELRHGRSHAMLRDGATLGFQVELDGGGRARIPAGPCMIDLGDARAERAPAALAGYLVTLDPDHGCGADLDLFPGDRIALDCLVPGDRVAIASPLAPDTSGGSPYRSGDALVASAPVCLRRVS